MQQTLRLASLATLGTLCILNSPAALAAKAEEYGCSLTVQDLAQDVREEQTQIEMKSDSKLRTYKLDTLKVIAKLDFHDLDQSPDKHVNAYWANHRAVTLSVVDLKDRVQAQFNNTVEAKSGPFEYQTKTTTYFIKLHCDPVAKIVVTQ
jgi:hypothetical protein